MGHPIGKYSSQALFDPIRLSVVSFTAQQSAIQISIQSFLENKSLILSNIIFFNLIKHGPTNNAVSGGEEKNVS